MPTYWLVSTNVNCICLIVLLQLKHSFYNRAEQIFKFAATIQMFFNLNGSVQL